MSVSNRFLPNYSVDDYSQWKGDWELLDGIPVAMTPSASGNHQRVATRLTGALFNALQAKNCSQCELFYEIDWHVDNHTVVRPDIVIVCGKRVEKYLDYAPALVIEILSSSTAEKDRTVKLQLYEQQGVKYYLIADPDTKSIVLHRLISKQYVQEEPVNVYTFELDDSCSIPLDTDCIFS